MKYGITVALMCLMLCACAENYSNGERKGTVVKLSEKGLIFKSWEGELLIGGVKQKADGKGGSSTVLNVLEFNVQDKDVLKKLEDALENGTEVKLTYKQWLLSPITINSDYVITAVKILN
jgi:hypothetical protein